MEPITLKAKKEFQIRQRFTRKKKKKKTTTTPDCIYKTLQKAIFSLIPKPSLNAIGYKTV